MGDDRDKRGRFRPGTSGNPRGRPPGRPDVRTQLSRAMLADAAEVVATVLEQAKEGDLQAASPVMARVLPSLKAQAERVEFDFDASAPVPEQIEQVLAAVAGGRLAPDVGQSIIASLGALSDARAVADLEQRIAELEEKETN